MPACHFDDAHIKMMLRKGFDFEYARDYCIMGCVEPQKSGRIHQWTVGGFTQWPITIDMVFNRGVLKSYESKQWLDNGELLELTTYEQFDNAVKRQLDYLLEMNDRGTVITQQVFRDVTPTPYMSLFVDGCIQTGKDVTAGGAVLYKGPGTIFADWALISTVWLPLKSLFMRIKSTRLQILKKLLIPTGMGTNKCVVTA